MHLEFDLTLRYRVPEAKNKSLQNLYFFNLYRSGSSMVEAVAAALAQFAGRTPLNLSRDLYQLGVEYFDTQNYGQSSIYLSDAAQLEKLTQFGGYLLYGFREIPIGFSEVFKHIGASILIVRDPRDIGISQYYAVAKHATNNRVVTEQILALRKQTSEQSLEEFILKDETIAFLNRIVQCYRPIIQRGTPVVAYEDMYLDGNFNLGLLCETVFDALGKYLPDDFSMDRFQENIQKRIENSEALKGHKTGGSIYNYTKLDPGVLSEYSDRLRDSLDLLGYD